LGEGARFGSGDDLRENTNVYKEVPSMQSFQNHWNESTRNILEKTDAVERQNN
jgi:hypothetical protein